jgi:hypothetical protein
MKKLLIAVAVLFTATTTISALGTENKVVMPSEDGYSVNFQDTTKKKKDKKKKDTTHKRDTSFAQYHH